MKEIEILVKVYSEKDKVIDILSKFEYKGLDEITDIYYYDPLRNNLKPINNQINECLRLRTKNNENFITYKKDKFDDNKKWLYSDEYETEIKDSDIIKTILKNLELKELIKIKNKKRVYKYNDYEIVFEVVDDLGLFLEVEYSTNKDVNILYIKKEIQEFINSLNIDVSEELNMGKPEMMLRNKNINL